MDAVPLEEDDDPSKVDIDVSKEVRPPQAMANRELTTRITLNVARAFVHFRVNCFKTIELPVVAPNPKSNIRVQPYQPPPMHLVTEFQHSGEMVS